MTRGPSRNNALVAVGLVVTAAAFAALPFVFRAAHSGQNLTASSAPLSSTAVMRGPFINSGSKDAGRDTDWVNGVWMGKRAACAPSESQRAAATTRRAER